MMVFLNLLLEQEWFSNMKMGKKPTLLVLSFTAVASISASVGYGAWITGDMLEKEDEIDISKSSRVPVAYIDDTKYFTLDAALDAAYNNGKEDKIYVIPNLAHSLYIQKSHIIEKGDSFLLPYEGETCLNEADNNGTGFADNNTSNRKTQVILKEQETLTIESGATMTIGAITGSGSNPQGQASSSYCELVMKTKSALIVEGNLNCYGFIKEDGDESNIFVNKGGTLTTPVSFYDHSSGTTSWDIYHNNDVFPYEQFDVASIRPKMTFFYGSSMIGRAHLWGSNVKDMLTNANLIGTSSSFINMTSEGSKLEWKFNDSKTNTTSSNFSDHSTDLRLSGDGYFDHLVVEITVSAYLDPYVVDSKDCYLPVPMGYSIYICDDSNFTIPSNIRGVKFMPGSALYCEAGANLTFDSNVSFYQNTTAADGTTSFNYPTKEAAIFENNGSVSINGCFDGVITSSSNKMADSNFSLCWSYEPVNDSKEGKDTEHVYNWGGAKGNVLNSQGEAQISELTAGSIYKSEANNASWQSAGTLIRDISKVSISETDEYNNTGISDGNSVGTFNLEADIKPIDPVSEDIKYTWTISERTGPEVNGYFIFNEENKGSSVTGEDCNKVIFHTDANVNTENAVFKIELLVSFKRKEDGKQSSKSATIQLTAKKNGCILPTSLVLMADGTYKQAGSLKIGDEVMCFNHEAGKIIPNKLIINSHIDEDADLYEVVHLQFENGKKTSLIDEHAYFDVEENKYVYLNKYNAKEYIGHRFFFIDNKLSRYTLKLENATIEKMLTKLAAPVSAYHLNVIVDDMLSVEGGISGLFNVFEYDPNTLAFDKEKMQRDIEKYGLAEYEAFKGYFPYKVFNELLPCKYFNVACGKGLLNWSIIKSYIAKWKDQLLENM